MTSLHSSTSMTQLIYTYGYSFLGCPVDSCNQLSTGIIQVENIEIDITVMHMHLTCFCENL